MPSEITRFEASPHVVRPQQQRSREALAKIMAASEMLLRTEGIDGFSIAAVAAAAGISVANIYRRFRAKEDILAAIKQAVTDRIERDVTEKLQGDKLTDVRKVVHALVNAMIKAFRHDEPLHRVLFDFRVKTPALTDIGTHGRRQIYLQYRTALMPVLPPIKAAQVDLITMFSFQMIASAIVGKASANDAALASITWKALGSEAATAAIAYLEVAIADRR